MLWHNRSMMRALLPVMVLLVLLGMTAPPALAQAPNYSLKTVLIWAPRHARACETFSVTYLIANRGPGEVTNLDLQFNVPDQFSVIRVIGSPVHLKVGQRAFVTAIIKVVAFVPGESRTAWVMLNDLTTPIRLVGRQVLTCPQR